jgi:hypothetical protein
MSSASRLGKAGDVRNDIIPVLFICQALIWLLGSWKRRLCIGKICKLEVLN